MFSIIHNDLGILAVLKQALTSVLLISSGGLDKNAVVFYRDTEQVRFKFVLFTTILISDELLTSLLNYY